MKKIVSIILAVVFVCSTFAVIALAEGLKGDVNKDGNISALDAREILQVVAGLKTTEDIALYDVNSDGAISALDARDILQYVVGLKDLPGTEEKPSEKPDEKPEDKPLDTKAEQLAYFITSFNGVKTNAVTATNGNTKVYNYDNYVYINPVIEGMYNMTLEPGAPSMKEELTADLSDELIPVNTTYEGSEAIASAFPPVGGTCNLTMDDISSISFAESGEYYLVEMKVKGKYNPTRYESVGNVATIVTKQDFEAEMSAEDKEKMSVDCDYKDATVKAKIEKSTGNMVEYSVDYPMIMIMNMSGLGEAVKVGMGFYEDWTIAY